MTDNNGIRSGSLQFWPRVRAKKHLPNANWKPLSGEGTNFLGFIGYKAGMISVWARDDTPDSLTKGKRIAIPATVLECPTMRIFSVRFYKDKKVLKDIVVDYDQKALGKLSKKPKTLGHLDKIDFEFDDVRAILYSNVKETGIKNKADVIEIAISGDKDAKLNFLKGKIGKNISVTEIFSKGLADVRGVTIGRGLCGTVKRFGIGLKFHKSEKGQRRPGSLGPWTPSRVSFRAPQAGQTGFHSRVVYNNQILSVGKIAEKDINKAGGFDHYGNLKTEFLVLRGSIPGPKKRQLLVTKALRPTKKQAKKKFEILELR